MFEKQVPTQLPQLARFRASELLSARKMNRTIEKVNRLAGGVRPPRLLGIASRTKGVALATATVVVVVEPQEDDTSLMVRKVKYAVSPPSAPEYSWDGDPFVVYADFGFVPIDYKDAFWSPEEEGGVPTVETPFLRAREREEFWLLGPPKEEAAVGVTARFFYLSMGVDHLICLDDDGNFVLVAKSWLLRRTPFASAPGFRPTRAGIRYTYDDSNKERDAERVSDRETEREIIVPSFIEGDPIYAHKLNPDEVDVAVEGEEPPELVWLDSNADGRAWAKKFED